MLCLPPTPLAAFHLLNVRSRYAFVGGPCQERRRRRMPPHQFTDRPLDTGVLALVTLPFPGKPNSPEAAVQMSSLRDQHVAAALEGVPAEVYVGGVTAEVADFYGIVRVYTPIVFALVLGLSFIIPDDGLPVDCHSAESYRHEPPLCRGHIRAAGAGVPEGVGTDLFGFQRADVIDAWIPLFQFAVLFGLSMDHHVFLLSRIRERYDESGDNTVAVAYGLGSTAGIITGAALIMVVVFGAFATGRTIVNQLVRFGLAVAVLLDDTLVRSVLVPASMEVLGKANWLFANGWGVGESARGDRNPPEVRRGPP